MKANFGDNRLPSRFWAKVAPQANGCWLWTGSVNHRGYGDFQFDGRQQRAHRVAFQRLVEPIPAGFVVHHLCNTPGCVTPPHLELATHRENTLRGNGLSAQNARKTACIHGHSFDAENTYLRSDGRRCRICKRAIEARSKAATRAAKREARNSFGACPAP